MVERFMARPGNQVLLAYYCGYLAALAVVAAYVLQAMADQQADRDRLYSEDMEGQLFRERMRRLDAERAAERGKEQPARAVPASVKNKS